MSNASNWTKYLGAPKASTADRARARRAEFSGAALVAYDRLSAKFAADLNAAIAEEDEESTEET
jgi:hypothetical protein